MTLYTSTFNRLRTSSTHRPRPISPVYLVLAVGVVSAVLFSCTTTTTPVASNGWRSATAMHYREIAPTFRGNPAAARISIDATAAVAPSDDRNPRTRQSPWKRTNDLKANSAARHRSAYAFGASW